MVSILVTASASPHQRWEHLHVLFTLRFTMDFLFHCHLPDSFARTRNQRQLKHSWLQPLRLSGLGTTNAQWRGQEPGTLQHGLVASPPHSSSMDGVQKQNIFPS